MFNRLNRAFQQALDPDKTASVKGRQPTLETLLPGDVVSFWDAGDAVVETALDCGEDLNGRETRWRWYLMDSGRMLEVAPDGDVLYERTEILRQDGADFEILTTDPEQGGVLKAFEARVRTGTAARNPALFEYGGRTYRVISTGVFDARPAGSRSYLPGGFSKAEVWRDIHPTRPGDNVYFELEPTDEDEEAPTTVLGIWTTHIALLFGRPLKGADIQAIYPRSEPGGPIAVTDELARFLTALGSTVLWSIVAVAISGAVFAILDRRFQLMREIFDENSIAAAVLAGSFVLGIFYTVTQIVIN